MRRDLLFYISGLLSLSWAIALFSPAGTNAHRVHLKSKPAPGSPLSLPRLLSPPAPQNYEQVCQRWDFHSIDGKDLSPELEEMSGLVWSRHWDQTLVHVADSGNKPLLLLSDAQGRLQASVPFAERSSDVEDLAAGPCPWSGSCLYIADSGDNLGLRSKHQIHIVDEASLFSAAPKRMTLQFQYADGKHHDVEALAVHPSSGKVLLFSKESAESRVFELSPPWRDEVLQAHEIAQLPIFKVTGAAYHPSGERLLLLNWQGATEFASQPLQGFPKLKANRSWYPYQRSIEITRMGQQEAIAYSPSGLSFLYSGERRRWSKKLWGIVHARCREPDEAKISDPKAL